MKRMTNDIVGGASRGAKVAKKDVKNSFLGLLLPFVVVWSLFSSVLPMIQESPAALCLCFAP